MKIVLASHNLKKLEELKRVMQPLIPGLELLGYDGPEPRETGTTFIENALIKARAAAAHTGLPAIADDSGLSVDILGGSPGIFSARWSGTKDDTANLELLLKQLEDIAPEHRSAAFVCAAAFVSATGEEITRLGVWPGEVLLAPQGENGFGYDPIFKPQGSGLSAAQMPATEKDASSHRRLAFEALAQELKNSNF